MTKVIRRDRITLKEYYYARTKPRDIRNEYNNTGKRLCIRICRAEYQVLVLFGGASGVRLSIKKKVQKPSPEEKLAAAFFITIFICFSRRPDKVDMESLRNRPGGSDMNHEERNDKQHQVQKKQAMLEAQQALQDLHNISAKSGKTKLNVGRLVNFMAGMGLLDVKQPAVKPAYQRVKG